MFIIYLVFRNGECVYVGQTVQSLAHRKGSHFSHARKGRGSLLGAAIRKHGESGFAFVRHIDCVDQKQLDSEEKRLIGELRPRYNVSPGGKEGFAAWNKGRKETRPDVIRNISTGAKNRKRTKRGKYSEAHKRKMSEGIKKQQAKPFICNETQEVFYNKIDCAAKLGLNASSLSVLLSGKTRLRKLKGYTFSYLAQEKLTLIDLETPATGRQGASGDAA